MVEININSNYSIGHLDEAIKPLALMLPKMIEYVKIFKDKNGDKNENNKFMVLCIDNKKLSKNIKPLGIRLKTYKILNSMLSQFMMTDM